MGVLPALLSGARSRRHAWAPRARPRSWERTAFLFAPVAPHHHLQSRHVQSANTDSPRLDCRQYFSAALASLADEHFHRRAARRPTGANPPCGAETRKVAVANDYLDRRGRRAGIGTGVAQGLCRRIIEFRAE